MATAALPATDTVEQLLGDEAASLLEHRCETVPKSALHLPGPDFVDRIWAGTDRSNRVLRRFGPFIVSLRFFLSLALRCAARTYARDDRSHLRSG